jgi:hypothetical protein
MTSLIRATVVAAALGCGLMGAAAPASAQAIATSRVSSLTATVYARCDPSSPARIVLNRGDAVSIDAVNEGWVQVRTATGGEQGCMRRSDLEASAAVDKAAQAQRARQAQAARGTPARARSHRAAPEERVVVSVNASYLTASRTFSDARTFDVNQETAHFSSAYDVEPRTGVDAGGFVRVWQGVAVGVAFTSHEDSRDIAITGTIPHPFLFGHDRSIAGTASGTREEIAAHLQFGYIVPAGRNVSAIVFAGPSFFTVRQSVVTAISYTDAYPYDEATFSGATVANEEAKKTGFNVGVDVAYYFTRNIGAGGIIRFASTKVDVSLGEVDAGGAMVGGGVRVRF